MQIAQSGPYWLSKNKDLSSNQVHSYKILVIVVGTGKTKQLLVFETQLFLVNLWVPGSARVSAQKTKDKWMRGRVLDTGIPLDF